MQPLWSIASYLPEKSNMEDSVSLLKLRGGERVSEAFSFSSASSTNTALLNSHRPDFSVEETHYPIAPRLNGEDPVGTSAAANVPDLCLGPASLDGTLKSSTPLPGEDHEFTTSAKNPRLPQRWYLHRAPDGKLTAIPPSPLCKDVTEDLVNESDASPVYAGYRVFDRDPRVSLGFGTSTVLEESATVKEDVESSVAMSVLDEPASFSFSFDDEDEDKDEDEDEDENGCNSSWEDSSARSVAINPNHVPLYIDAEHFNLQQTSPSDRQSAENRKESVGDMGWESISQGPAQLFKFLDTDDIDCGDQTEESLSSDFSHVEVASRNFRNRRGFLWNSINRELEKYYLCATNLTEKEFIDLVSCDMDEVTTWLEKYCPSIVRRSIDKWRIAHQTLKHAGIQPRELNEEVLDVFEWMTKKEQSSFIKGYQLLYARVKAAKEGLHFTRPELEHFSKLSLADKMDFINFCKDRREERELQVLADTATFTAKLRRRRDSFQWSLHALPFVDCADLDFLQCNTNIAPASHRPRHSVNTLVDNFNIEHVHFGLDQRNSRRSATSFASSPLLPPTSAVYEQPTANPRITVYTGDGRPRYDKLNQACQKTGEAFEASNVVLTEPRAGLTVVQPLPTPPSTVVSVEGVIPPVTSESVMLVNDKPAANLFVKGPKMVVEALDISGIASEPCTPSQKPIPAYTGPSVSYVTPPPPLNNTCRGLPSAYTLDCDLKKQRSSQETADRPRSLRKKVSLLWGTLKSKKNRQALRDVKF